MDARTRFSGLVRKGLRFRKKFETAKQGIQAGFSWYPYDSFANLFYMQQLLQRSGMSLADAIGNSTVIDIGAADGALSLFLEHLGHRVCACDFAGTNINRMQGIRRLVDEFRSAIEIRELDLDGRFELTGVFGLALFLGTLYHLKNPFYTLEELSKHARHCFVSTRVARWNPDHTVHLDRAPVAYLLGADECNSDTTNYWIFSPTGLDLLARRAGWEVLGAVSSGSAESDPRTAEGDERMFLLLRSSRL